MIKENRTRLIRIIAGALLLAAAFIIEKKVELPMWQYLLIYLVPYAVVGYDVVAEAVENIFHGEVFDEDFLMCIATFGALGIGFMPGNEPQFAEAVFVMLFFQVGEFFEDAAEGKTRRSVASLMDLRPDTANVIRNGEMISISPEEIEVGEIIVRTEPEKICGIFKQYMNNDEATAEAWRDGVYHTGDTAWRDEDGYYWYVGRTDDLIKSSGYRIGPFEIESVLMELPYVLECAVVGVPDPTRGQVVKAFIVLTAGHEGSDALVKEIQDYVKTRTAPYKYPRQVEFVPALPKTVSGKIRRSTLRGEQDVRK